MTRQMFSKRAVWAEKGHGARASTNPTSHWHPTAVNNTLTPAYPSSLPAPYPLPGSVEGYGGPRFHYQSHAPYSSEQRAHSCLPPIAPFLPQGLWKAMEALASTIPKEEHHQYVRPLKEAVATATEKERRKRRAAAAAAGTAAAAAAIQSTPLLVAGFCLPKALAPVLPIYLAGVLQGSSTEVRGHGFSS